MRTLADLAHSCATLPNEIQTGQRRGVQKAALHVTTAIRQEIKAATGGDSRLSGVGRSGGRVGAKYDISGGDSPRATIKATGPIQLIEHDTSPHEIKPRRKKALHWGNRFSMVASHPGTKAKEPFAKGVNKTAHETTAIFDREVQVAIVKAFK